MKRAIAPVLSIAMFVGGYLAASSYYNHAEAQAAADRAAELDAGPPPPDPAAGPSVEISGGAVVTETHLEPEARPQVAEPVTTTTTITTTTAPDDPAAGLPDAVEDPESYLGVLKDLWRSGAGVVAVLAAFLGLGVYLRKRYGWFSEGWQALAFASFATGVTTLVQMAASGVTPNAKMIAAVFGGLALAAIKTYGATPEKKS